jgi:hypothetical protein
MDSLIIDSEFITKVKKQNNYDGTNDASKIAKEIVSLLDE